MIIAADKLNPQIAARLVPAFGRWRRFEPKRAAMMRAALEQIVATPGLSKDVFEQASKSPSQVSSRRSSFATSFATWLAARLSAGPMAGGAVGGTLAVKRRVSTRLPPAVDSAASYRTIDLAGRGVITETLQLAGDESPGSSAVWLRIEHDAVRRATNRFRHEVREQPVRRVDHCRSATY